MSDDSDSSDNIDYRRKYRKRESDQEKYSIKLCARLKEKLMTTDNKLKIIRLRMDEDPLQRRIYLLTFVESLVMTLSYYEENCEVLLDYPK